MAEKSDFQNRRRLLLHLLDYGNATKQDLVQWTGLSNTTVSDTINTMLKTGFITTGGMKKSIGGRRSVIYSIDEDFGQFAGLELYKDGVRIALCNAKGQIKSYFEVDRGLGELHITLLYRAIDILLEHKEAINVLAMGIGVDGEIDYAAQTVLKSDVLGWKSVPLKEIVERRFYVPVFIDSPINGQICLRKFNESTSCPEHFMVLNELFPYKAGICLDGHICRGRNNLCGERDFMELVQMADSLYDLLSLQQIWIACMDDEKTKQLEEIYSSCEKSIQIYSLDPSELAWGMALEAETKWFGTIYSCTKNPINPSEVSE